MPGKATTEGKRKPRQPAKEKVTTKGTKAAKSSRSTKAGASKSAPSSTQNKSTAKKSTSKKAVATAIITSEERHRMIAEKAYYLAEQRGFQEGNPEHDWLSAAAEIDRMIIRNG